MLKISVNYTAESAEEVLSLASQLSELNIEIKEPALGQTEDNAAIKDSTSEEEKTMLQSGPAEKMEGEKAYSIEDIQKLAVQANKKGKLSQVKELLEKHEIARVSEVPEDLRSEVGQAIEKLVK